MVCRDENIRRCVLIMFAWLADYMENVNIHSIKVNWCQIYFASRNELGLLPKQPYLNCHHTAYVRLWEASNHVGYVA